MRIGCDLDGVLADLHRRFAETALSLFPTLDASVVAAPDAGASPPGPSRDLVPSGRGAELMHSLSRRQTDAVWETLCDIGNFWETLEEVEGGIVRRLAAVAEEHSWEVIFLTSRPRVPGRTVQKQSQRWLSQQGFALPSVYVVDTMRGRVADALALDVVVDDRPENCLDVALQSRARAILVWRGGAATAPKAALRMGIGVVTTMAECLDRLVEAAADGGAPGWRERLMRVFGIRPRPVTKP